MTSKMFATTNFSVYLKTQHPELYTEFEKKAKELKMLKKPSHHQLPLMECEDQVYHRDINDILYMQYIWPTISLANWDAMHIGGDFSLANRSISSVHYS